MPESSVSVSFATEVKEAALGFGAHLVGIADAERLAGAPAGFRATDILPGARSVVVMGVGLPQGLSDCWKASIWSYLYPDVAKKFE